jgi:hypothetical protein
MGRHGAIATAAPPGATLPPPPAPASGASSASSDRRYRRPARLAGRLWVVESGRSRPAGRNGSPWGDRHRGATRGHPPPAIQ